MIPNVRHWAALAIATALAGPASGAMAAPAQPAAKAPAKGKSALALPTLERFKLDNGLEVAFMPLSGAPAVSVQVWYRAGSKDEARDRRGSAHMFEHMMFKGSQHVRSEDHERVLSALGGYVNAATNEDAILGLPPARRAHCVQWQGPCFAGRSPLAQTAVVR
jgi:zinc protease